MTDRSVTHASFVIERTYDASPARVFAACSDPAVKRRWFVGNTDWDNSDYKLDFRVGGQETNSVRPDGSGPTYTYRATIEDIVPDQRIVSTYEMAMDGRRVSVSVATLELVPEGSGTRVIFTEQDALFDGLDKMEYREAGTKGMLDNLGALLAKEPANA
jgi:uncharacterized protein YndB with AHSA1/START domain